MYNDKKIDESYNSLLMGRYDSIDNLDFYVKVKRMIEIYAAIDLQDPYTHMDYQALFYLIHDSRIDENILEKEKCLCNTSNSYREELYSSAFSVLMYEDIKYWKYSIKCLNSDDVNRILIHGFIEFNNFDLLSTEKIYYLIDNSNSKKKSKIRLKFLWVDCKHIGRYILNKIEKYIELNLPDFYLLNVKPDFYMTKKQYMDDKKRIIKIEASRKYDNNSAFWSLVNKKRNAILRFKIVLLDIDNNPYCEIIDLKNKTTIANIPYEYEEWKEDYFSINLKMIDDTWNVIGTSKISLVYLYGRKIYDLEPVHVNFSKEYYIDIDEGNKRIEILKGDNSSIIPKAFFGEKIDSIQTIIGKNGSGKSSIFEIVCQCPIFNAGKYRINNESKNNTADFFLIYKIGEKYYYSTNIDENENFEIVENGVNKYSADLNIQVIKISNVFNLFSNFDNEFENKNIWNLSTNYLFASNIVENNEREGVQVKADFKRIQDIEILRIKNYQKIIQADLLSGNDKYDTYENRLIKNVDFGMSSGELARLQFFSRILNVFKIHSDIETLPRRDYTDNYILLFDEAELYFHPEWQRRLIFDLCRFIDAITKDNFFIHSICLILSSNSPFYMSDLPLSSVNILGDNDTAISEKTFGQNINTLLKHQFFMDNVIGEFASEKIRKAFRFLRSKENHEEEYQKEMIKEIEYICNQLGESLLKELLEEELDNFKESIF